VAHPAAAFIPFWSEQDFLTWRFAPITGLAESWLIYESLGLARRPFADQLSGTAKEEGDT
jgi:hypothetical protein